MADSGSGKARALGINHIVLEVDDIDEALEWYGAIFEFELRGRREDRAFIDLGDQFIQLSTDRTQEPDGQRHFGLVVNDRSNVREALEKVGAEMIGKRLNFRDPWGNRVEVVPYDDIQFTKAPHILRGMGVEVEKTASAIEELTKKGLAPDGAPSKAAAE